MVKPAFDEIEARPELVEQLVARARRARLRTVGVLTRRFLRRVFGRRCSSRPDGEPAPAVAGETAISIRLAGSDDRERIQDLVRGLTPGTRYLRFFSGIRELPPQWLDRFARPATESELTLLAFARMGRGEIPVGMAQYAAAPDRGSGEFAVVVADAWQGKGIGKRLIRHLACIAQAAGLARLEGDVLAENGRMLRMASTLGIAFDRDPENPYALHASLRVSDPRWRCSAAIRSGSGVPALQV